MFRSIVECGTTVFNTHLKKGIRLFKGLQNNFTRNLRLVARCSDVCYRYIPCDLVSRKMFGLARLESRRQKLSSNGVLNNH